MIIIGVDPGSKATGYGVIEKNSDTLNWITYGRISPFNKLGFYERVFDIFVKIKDILQTYRPDEMAVEDLFYYKNIKSSIKLAHIKSAVIIAAFISNIPVFEYTPLQIKKAVAGYGNASKEQVRDMVRFILNIKKDMDLDSSDALAVAICHANHIGNIRDDSLYNRKDYS